MDDTGDGGGSLDFDYLCVLDFEATCNTKDEMRRGDMEIIEFPTVLVNCRTLQREAEFQRFVKTKKYPLVSPYCTEVTGITQVRCSIMRMQTFMQSLNVQSNRRWWTMVLSFPLYSMTTLNLWLRMNLLIAKKGGRKTSFSLHVATGT